MKRLDNSKILSEGMQKSELFSHIREINAKKITLSDIEVDRENEYYSTSSTNPKLKYAQRWNLVSILTELASHYNCKYLINHVKYLHLLTVKTSVDTLFDKLISSSVLVNLALFSTNFLEDQNSKKRKKKNAQELLVDAARIIRSTLICNEQTSLVSGFDHQYTPRITGEGLMCFCLSDS